ncbi:geranylgeranyl pyrophosphate synthase-like [Acanthaster planci]|uniref:Geranylgeranyl pyrophosphate synthase-like n=1 Tax=Acanthaster planci TaxID=133434 RepID=A0A8B7Z917_ACAPL|nr:geranylgeranyl pyrophosphate synthase-like [Acanthaster planci]XP_022101374.1 geranylgeranyl pyrophosphate synthase-like [Acanthaster planci]
MASAPHDSLLSIGITQRPDQLNDSNTRKLDSSSSIPCSLHSPTGMFGTGATTMTKEDREKAQDRILLEPYAYILQVPGKKIRIKLTKAFNHWLQIPDDTLDKVSEITQMLHNASLLIDDIEDNSKLRRGIPVAHSIFGTAQTINAANYVYFLGLQKTIELGHPKATTIFMEQLLLLHQGQGMDIWWRDAFVCPTEDEYKEMVLKKTGGLFGLAVRLMQLFSENKSDFTPLSDMLGLYFQIRDDLANLQSREYTENKSYCEDLTEGKFSFPIIHGILSRPEDNQVMNILRKRTTDVEIKKYCVDHLEKIGSFDYTKKALVELEEIVLHEMSKLGANPYLEAMLEELGKLYKEPDQ